jgi:hypothetical protein
MPDHLTQHSLMLGAKSSSANLALDQQSKPPGKDTNYLLGSVNNRFMRIVLAVAETGNMTSAANNFIYRRAQSQRPSKR